MSFAFRLDDLAAYKKLAALKIEEASRNSRLSYPPFAIDDVHFASSCLQKALRRGDRNFAQASAEHLATHDPERLWRRLVVCAFEDIGLADLPAIAQVTAAAMSRSFRLISGEIGTRLYLIDLLAAAPKDRRLDDLYMLGDRFSRGLIQPEDLGAVPLGPLVEKLVQETALLIRRCERRVPNRSFSAVIPSNCEHELLRFKHEGKLTHSLAELCAAGIRRSRSLLPLFLPVALATSQESDGSLPLVDEPLAATPIVCGVPAYAIDGYTRAGRVVLSRLGREHTKLKSILRPIPGSAHISLLHHLLFCVEGGCCTPRLADPLAQTLGLVSTTLGTALPPHVIPDALATMREALPFVHALRADVLAKNPSQERLL